LAPRIEEKHKSSKSSKSKEKELFETKTKTMSHAGLRLCVDPRYTLPNPWQRFLAPRIEEKHKSNKSNKSKEKELFETKTKTMSHAGLRLCVDPRYTLPNPWRRLLAPRIEEKHKSNKSKKKALFETKTKTKTMSHTGVRPCVKSRRIFLDESS